MGREVPRLPRDRVKALTFDCYGTLIDWDRGIEAAFGRLESLRRSGVAVAEIRALRLEREKEIEAGPFLPYVEVLARSLTEAAAQVGATVAPGEARGFAQSVRTWSPFPDTAAALERLRTRSRLAIVSNVDTDLLMDSMRLIGVPFDVWVTAEQVRSYKPRPAHFQEVLRRLGLSSAEVLHVAQSPYHDIRPAQEMGWAAVWINRQGESYPYDSPPAWTYPDLASFAADLLGEGGA